MNMKGKKIFASVILVIAMLCIAFGQCATYAVTNDSFKVGIKIMRDRTTPNTGYSIGNPAGSGASIVYKLVSYDSAGTHETNKNLYCVKGGVGETWNNDVNGKADYTIGYDLRADKSDIIGLINQRFSNITASNYYNILWIVDNLFIPGEYGNSTKEAAVRKSLLKSAGIDYDDEQNAFYDIDNSDRLTDDDIEVIQQLALWYYTNEGDSDYHRSVQALTSGLFLNDGSGWDAITSLAPRKILQFKTLYAYFIETPDNIQDKYNASNELKNPVTVSEDALKIKTTSDSKYLIGPIKVNNSDKFPYTLDIEVNNEGGTTIPASNYTIVDEDENAVDKDSADEFYIKADTNKVTVNVTVNYYTTNATEWVKGGATIDNEQPVLEVEKKLNSVTYELTPNDSPFDLALRKFITAISSDVTIDNSERITDRVPSVTNLDALRNGTVTTATYNHDKTALKVKNGDYIEYTIRVYNEGSVSGYAQEITDYILENYGLEFVTPGTGEGQSKINQDYGWVKNGNKVTTDYLSKAHETAENKTLIEAFDDSKTTPDYKELKIEFKVVKPSDYEKGVKLVNIAEISKARREDSNTDIVKDEDRDSNPSTVEDDKYNYPNDGYTQDHQHEDDIDFEPVELFEFDLSLRKFISAVSSDGPTFDANEYLTGSSSREPAVSYNNGTFTYEHPKDPVPVKSGDYVLYTLRIYNEGEIDGYASLIRDYIGQGLEYELATSGENSINADYEWHLETDGTITTNYLDKDHTLDKATNTIIEGKNLIKAFDKTKSVSNTDPLNPDYRDVQVVLHVTASDSTTDILVNRAQIADDTDENGNEVDDKDSTPDNDYNENEDDNDYDQVKLQTFDLSLRKFITEVDGKTNGLAAREPQEVTDALKAGTTTTATYNHSKTPLEVKKGSTIKYTIRAYNEGDVDGYAAQITDFLPEYLEFVEGSTTNTQYGWTEVEGSNGRRYQTNYLASDDNKLKAREEITDGYKLYYHEVEIECRVKNDAAVTDGMKLTNIAEITEYKNEDKQTISRDIDSSSNSLINNETTDRLPTDSELPTYKDDQIDQPYVPGQQDDDDFEKVVVRTKIDLALTKFIIAISKDETIEESEYLKEADGSYTRQTRVDTNPLKQGGHDADYEQDKSPLAVENNAYVLYNIRVYNEGDVDVYAGEVKDYLPDNLVFVEGEFNNQYGWTANGQTVTTTLLSSTNGTDKMLKAFDAANDDGKGSKLDYKDLPILCRVNNAEAGKKLINTAEITKYEDKDGHDITTDVDSQPNNKNPKNVEERTQDDDDYEVVYVKEFDLALRKYISSIDGTATDREPQVDVTPLKNGEDTAIYNHPKTPLPVNKGSKIVFTLRVYNEGDIDGYASKIIDYLPENLEFVTDSTINTQYGWYEVEGSNGRKYETEYLAGPRVHIPEEPAPDTSDYMIKAFDGTTLDSKYVQIEVKVSDNVKAKDKLTNLAEITEYQDEKQNVVNPDRDSSSNNINVPEDKDLPGYKDDEINKEYVPGQQDDDDFEKVYIPQFDLALRKYITNIAGKEETSRTPTVTYEDGKIEYNHSKSPMQVVVGDVVVYTIRVYNEGETAGYAAEVADDMPEYLTFLPDNAVNKEYQWKMYDNDGNETDDISKAVQIKTKYLSKENEKTPGANLLKAFDASKEISDTNPDHRDIKVAFQVNNNAPVQKVITNKAQITENTDSNGNPVEDIDSIPGEWNEGEDDQDLENIIPQQFDLSLIKYVSQVIVTEDGKTTTTETKNTGNKDTDIIPKVEIHKKKLFSTVVKFVYTIRITNEGDIEGYAKEITDYVPTGLSFVEADNPNWTVKGDGVIATRELEDTLLKPGESAAVKVVFTWINGADNLNLKRNLAEISEDYNEKHVPDRDSTPNNKVDGEDDIDFADVLLSIKTGKAKTYILLTGAVLIVLAGGIILIKKYAM